MLPGKAAIEVPTEPVPESSWFKPGESYRILNELYTYDDLVGFSAEYGASIEGTIYDWLAFGHKTTLRVFAAKAPAEPGEKTYLEALQRTRELLETMSVNDAVGVVAGEIGNDEWGMGEIGEGYEDWRRDFFDEKLGKGVPEDPGNDTQRWVYKLWYDELIKVNSEPEYPKTYYPSDMGQFVEGGDAWEALNLGRQVTLDKTGNIIDVWDPVTKKTYDVLGNEITDRETSYRTSPVKPKVEPYKAPPEGEVPKTWPPAIPDKPTLPQPMFEWDDLQGRDTINALIQYHKDSEKHYDAILFNIGWCLEFIRVCLKELQASSVSGTQSENYLLNQTALHDGTTKLEEEGIFYD
jgi:hypothetical protein